MATTNKSTHRSLVTLSLPKSAPALLVRQSCALTPVFASRGPATTHGLRSTDGGRGCPQYLKNELGRIATADN